MKIMALADLDGEVPPRGALRDVYQATGIDAVVFAGSVLPRGDVPVRDARRLYTAFFDALAALTLPTVVVPGHLDTPTELFGRVATRYASRTPPIIVVAMSGKPGPTPKCAASSCGLPYECTIAADGGANPARLIEASSALVRLLLINNSASAPSVRLTE